MAIFRTTATKFKSPANRKSLFPYLLLAPGLLYLAIFFLAPIATLGQMSTKTKNADGITYSQSFRFQNYLDAFSQSSGQFARSFIYATLATILALAIAYPLAYGIAFKAGRFKNVLLVLIVEVQNFQILNKQKLLQNFYPLNPIRPMCFRCHHRY